jgi:hypothetical protein
MTNRYSFVLAAFALCLAGPGASRAGAAAVDFVTAVKATHPLVYVRLEAPSGDSVTGSSSYATTGGVAVVAGAPIGMPGNQALSFNGTSGALTTTFKGGIATTGSLMAWVNLAAMPASDPHIQYVGGESQVANDYDIQFESDNKLHFYTAAGSNITYLPDPTTLVGRWHMIVVTMDLSTKTRKIYWDGKAVSTDAGGGNPNKTAPFTLAESSVFTGRFFNGRIDEAALWGRALSASEVASMYAATVTPATK